MYAWKQTELTVNISVRDTARLAKLPGKLTDWYVDEVKAIENVGTDDADDTVFRITFKRGDDHQV